MKTLIIGSVIVTLLLVLLFISSFEDEPVTITFKKDTIEVHNGEEVFTFKDCGDYPFPEESYIKIQFQQQRPYLYNKEGVILCGGNPK